MLERDLAVLGLKPRVEDLEIRRTTYRALAKRYHPDLSARNTNAMFDRLTYAYNDPAQSKEAVTELSNMLLYGSSATERIGISGGFRDSAPQAMRDPARSVRIKDVLLFAGDVGNRRRHG